MEVNYEKDFAIIASEYDLFANGTWCMYSLKTGEKLDAVSETKRTTQGFYSEVMSTVNETDNLHEYYHFNDNIEIDSAPYKNGTYRKDNSVYSADGTKLFDIPENTYTFSGCKRAYEMYGDIIVAENENLYSLYI